MAELVRSCLTRTGYPDNSALRTFRPQTFQMGYRVQRKGGGRERMGGGGRGGEDGEEGEEGAEEEE